MPEKPQNFWQELKRRKVVRVIIGYAATAFIIMEAGDIMLPRFGLPDRTVTFLIILLIIGLPIVIILSWIFDITPEGIKKTESSKAVKDKEVLAKPAKRKLRVGDIINAVLLLAVVILLYPKIFNKDKFDDIRDEDGRISIAVLPFDNLTGDSSLYYWQTGISEYLINMLGCSQELAVTSSQVVLDVLASSREVNTASLSPNIARQTAIKIDATTYITGNFIGKENDVSIMLNLVNTENDKLIWSTNVSGDLATGFRAVLDHLSDTVINYLEIRALEERVEAELTNAFPNSVDAYRYYIDGLNAIIDSDYESAIEYLKTAYNIDTTFTFAAFYLAFAHNMSNAGDPNCVRWSRRAHELKNNLPKEYRTWVDLWHSLFVTKDINLISRYADRMYDADIQNRFLWFDLATIYADWLDDYSKAINAYERVEAINRQWENDWKYIPYYGFYARHLLIADRPDEAIRIANKGIKMDPEEFGFDMVMGAAGIMKNDTTAINKFTGKIRDYGFGDAIEEHIIGSMYCWAKDTIGAVDHFKRAYELDSRRLGSLWFIIECQLRSNINFEECYRLSEYGLKNQPGSNSFLWQKGLSLHKLGRHQEAIEILLEVEDQWITYSKILQRDIKEVQSSLNREREY